MSRPKLDKITAPVDISKVIDLALVYNPYLATADLSTIRMWCDNGCTIEQDIIPIMKRIMERKKGIAVFKYFTNPILESRDKRLIVQKQAKEAKERPTEYYLSVYRWKRKMGIPLTVAEEEKLKECEEIL